MFAGQHLQRVVRYMTIGNLSQWTRHGRESTGYLVFILRAQGSLFLRPQWYIGVLWSRADSCLGGSARSTFDHVRSQTVYIMPQHAINLQYVGARFSRVDSFCGVAPAACTVYDGKCVYHMRQHAISLRRCAMSRGCTCLTGIAPVSCCTVHGGPYGITGDDLRWSALKSCRFVFER